MRRAGITRDRPIRRRLAALAALLLALAHLAPTAALPRQAAGAVPVCTAAGVVWLDPASGAPAVPDRDGTARHLCCLLHHAAAGPPPPVAVPVPLARPLRAARPPRRTPARRASTGAAHRPRAPPSVPPQ